MDPVGQLHVLGWVGEDSLACGSGRETAIQELRGTRGRCVMAPASHFLSPSHENPTIAPTSARPPSATNSGGCCGIEPPSAYKRMRRSWECHLANVLEPKPRRRGRENHAPASSNIRCRQSVPRHWPKSWAGSWACVSHREAVHGVCGQNRRPRNWELLAGPYLPRSRSAPWTGTPTRAIPGMDISPVFP